MLKCLILTSTCILPGIVIYIVMSDEKRPAPLSDIARIVDFMLEDPDHWLVKRHHRIHLINLIVLQQKLSSLEGEFDAVVRKDTEEDNKTLSNHQSVTEKNDLLKRIQETVREYGLILLSVCW